MKPGRIDHKSFYIKNNVYVLGGHDDYGEHVTQVDKYSLITHKWEQIATISGKDFCACAFMDHIFVIGGRDDNEDYFDSCLKFHTKSNELNEISKMNEERLNAACTVFEERVVVTGGYTFEAFLTTTVEAYDHLS